METRITRSTDQPTPIISILECLGFIATTSNTRLVAIVGRESTALNGARALAIASGKTHIVEIEIPGQSIRRLWVRPQPAMATSSTVQQTRPSCPDCGAEMRQQQSCRVLRSGCTKDALYVCPALEAERVAAVTGNAIELRHPAYMRYWPESALPQSSLPASQLSDNPAVYEVLGRLKSRKPQAGYLVYTGSEVDCKLARSLLPGSRARRNGETEKNTWILVVPMPVVYSSTTQPTSTSVAA